MGRDFTQAVRETVGNGARWGQRGLLHRAFRETEIMPTSDQPRRVCPGEGFIEIGLFSEKGAKRHQMASLMLQLSLLFHNQMLNKSPCFPSCCWDQTNRQQCADAHLYSQAGGVRGSELEA